MNAAQTGLSFKRSLLAYELGKSREVSAFRLGWIQLLKRYTWGICGASRQGWISKLTFLWVDFNLKQLGSFSWEEHGLEELQAYIFLASLSQQKAHNSCPTAPGTI